MLHAMRSTTMMLVKGTEMILSQLKVDQGLSRMTMRTTWYPLKDQLKFLNIPIKEKLNFFCFVSMSILVIDESADDQAHISV